MADTDPITVPLNCPHCGGSIEVACDVEPGAPAQTVRFRCPYCDAPRDFDAPGAVLFVAMRQPGGGPETRH